MSVNQFLSNEEAKRRDLLSYLLRCIALVRCVVALAADTLVFCRLLELMKAMLAPWVCSRVISGLPWFSCLSTGVSCFTVWLAYIRHEVRATLLHTKHRVRQTGAMIVLLTRIMKLLAFFSAKLGFFAGEERLRQRRTDTCFLPNETGRYLILLALDNISQIIILLAVIKKLALDQSLWGSCKNY